MRKLYAFFEDQVVGEFVQDQELVHSFSYSDSWIKSKQSFPLSLSMPLEEKTFGNKITLSYFENLLPEGEVRKSLEETQGIKGAFSFLEEFGRDCAGAIVLVDNENYANEVDHNQKVKVPMDKIYKAISENSSVADVVAKTSHGYLSLAGAQDKFPAIYKNGEFYLPTHGCPTTHIIKVPIWRQGVKDSVFNEYFCMELARKVGFNIPKCEVLQGDFPLFIIERYDREIIESGEVRRIHQQDFCQAQGIVSSHKYESKGGPTIVDNYNLILSNVSPARKIINIETYLRWLAFNLIIGNNDSHSKNLSFVLVGKGVELAPIYDLLCTSVYPKLNSFFSFRINGKEVLQKMRKIDFEKLDSALQVKSGTTLGHLKIVKSQIESVIADHKAELNDRFSGIKIINKISSEIEKRFNILSHQKIIK